MTTVVTLSNKSDITVTAVPNKASNKNCLPFAILPIFAARTSNPPVLTMIATTAIIEPRRKTTFQSTASKASSGE